MKITLELHHGDGVVERYELAKLEKSERDDVVDSLRAAYFGNEAFLTFGVRTKIVRREITLGAKLTEGGA